MVACATLFSARYPRMNASMAAGPGHRRHAGFDRVPVAAHATEAQALRSKGDAYRAYQARVPAFLPRPPRRT